jgi:hypothetical protein
VQKFFQLLLLWALILSACSTVPSSPQPAPPTATDTPIAIPTPAVPDPVTSPVDSSSDPGACGYQWAYQDLPALSRNVQQSLQALQPEAQATAFAFGENCIGADGSIVRFIPLETDFNITLQVNDLANESELGEWIVKVMQVIVAIPTDQIVGPRPGRVSLGFQSGSDQQVVSFYINQYQELQPGLPPDEIYQALQMPQ